MWIAHRQTDHPICTRVASVHRCYHIKKKNIITIKASPFTRARKLGYSASANTIDQSEGELLWKFISEHVMGRNAQASCPAPLFYWWVMIFIQTGLCTGQRLHVMLDKHVRYKRVLIYFTDKIQLTNYSVVKKVTSVSKNNFFAQITKYEIMT